MDSFELLLQKFFPEFILPRFVGYGITSFASITLNSLEVSKDRSLFIVNRFCFYKKVISECCFDFIFLSTSVKQLKFNINKISRFLFQLQKHHNSYNCKKFCIWRRNVLFPNIKRYNCFVLFRKKNGQVIILCIIFLLKRWKDNLWKSLVSWQLNTMLESYTWYE